MSNQAFESQFLLEDLGDQRFGRLIDRRWGNLSARIFGGYSAALSLAAAARLSPHPCISTAQIMFMDAVQPGEIEIDVFPERVGRSLAILRMVATQARRQVLGGMAWFRRGVADDAAHAQADADRGDPDGSQLHWLDEFYDPFYQWFESRGVDYPQNAEALMSPSGSNRIELWSRPRGGPASSGLMSQLFDVLIADAHVGDPALRADQAAPDRLLSLDLHIQWAAAPHYPGWRQIVAVTSPEVDGISLCTGELRNLRGDLRATVSQQTWCMPKRS